MLPPPEGLLQECSVGFLMPEQSQQWTLGDLFHNQPQVGFTLEAVMPRKREVCPISLSFLVELLLMNL